MEDALNLFIEDHELDELLAGSPIDTSDIPSENFESVLAVLIHCCVNGPFSPHKVTNYPIAGETSLDSLMGKKISNNGLRKTCEKVSEWLKQQGYDKGYMFKYGNGEFWPQNGYVAE